MVEPKTELQRQALAEARRHELDVYQRALDVQWLDNRMENGRMGRCLALIQREAEMEKDFQERTDHAAIVNATTERETKLGIEIAKVRHDEMCQLLRRHYLREQDSSLKDLARKLQAGYACRDLQQQILHNQYRRLQEKAEEKRTNDILLDALYNDQEAKEREDREKIERIAHYGRELQQQLVNRQLQKQCQYEDSLVEKKMLEDIMRTISDEDQRELQHKRDMMENTRADMRTFQQAREAWRLKQKEMVIIEERNIQEQNKRAADRTSAIIAERNEKMRIKEETNARVAAKILADEAARQERENIIKLLQEQEYLEKNIQNDIDEKEKLLRVKQQTKEALNEQMNEKLRAQREARAMEEEFRKESEARMANEIQHEKEKIRLKKEKGRQYSNELLGQIQERANRVKREREQEAQRAVYVWEWDRKWHEEVAEERKKMIEEHVPQLLGYLQAGVVQKEDLPVVRAGANKDPQLAKLDIEGMAISTRPHRFSKCNAKCRELREY